MHHLTRNIFSVSLLTFASPAINAQDLTSNLTAHFPLDGTPDDVVEGLTPTVTSGQPGFCADRFGTANGSACFDGASFWSYGDVLDMDTSDFALSFWMRPDSVPLEWEVSPGLFSSGIQPVCKGTTVFASPTHSGYTLQLRQPVGDSYLLDWVTGGQNDDVHIAESPITIGEWMQVVVLRCDTVISMYLDGVLAAMSITPPNRNLNTDIYFTLGALNREPSGEPVSEWFIGAVDDVRIYRDRCLSQETIDCLVNPELCPDGVTAMNDSKNALRVYPNPANNTLTAIVPENLTGPWLITVTDATGRRVFEQRSQHRSIILDVADWKAGAYFGTLQGDQWQAHERFIKE